ncbi:MAG: carboxypeptidase regulatory-like domain-containing protein [Planctomycetes bacterium]|nr:carboxypeptidase regulatory-like domain-containing protein [Planctomycetota bacterium]
MRPLIVLAIVLAAAAAFFFATDPSSGPAGPEALSGPEATEAPTPEEPAEEASLVGPAVAQGREGVAAPVRTDVLDNQPAAAAEASLTGLILDPEGQPVKGAQVTLTRFGTTNMLFLEPTVVDRSGDRTAKTDDSGRYSFARVAPYERYALMIRHPEFAPLEEGDVQALEGEANEVPPIKLAKGVALRGVVKDSAGNTVPGAALLLGQMAMAMTATDDPNALEGTTNLEGKYEFTNLANGNYVLQVTADGYGQVVLGQINVAGDGDVQRDVVLEIAMMLAGVVTDQDGLPLPEATVTAYSIGNRENRTQTQGATDDNGEFTLLDVPGGTYTLRVSAEGFKVGSVARAEAGDVGIHVSLERLPTISGQAVDAQTGEPLKRFTVSVRPGTDAAIENTVRLGKGMDVADDEGRFTVTCPKDGSFMVDVEAPGYAASFSEPVMVTASQELGGVIVRVKRGGGIKGRILDGAGNPIARAVITTRDDRWTGSDFDLSMGTFPGVAAVRKSRTDSRGEFTINGLAPTTYLIEIEHPQYAGHAVRNVIVGDGVATDVGAQTLVKGAVISGVVRGPSGVALPGAQVKLMMAPVGNEFPAQYGTKADKEGRYRISGVRPGTYWAHATRPVRGGDNPFAHSNDIKNTRRQVVLADGQEIQGQDFDLSN